MSILILPLSARAEHTLSDDVTVHQKSIQATQEIELKAGSCQEHSTNLSVICAKCRLQLTLSLPEESILSTVIHIMNVERYLGKRMV
jgi:hypothetical protein